MSRISDAQTPGRGTVVLTWFGRVLALLLTALSLLVAAARLFGAGSFIGYLASRGTVFDIWGVLHTLDVLFSLAAIVGAGFALLRRKLLVALLFSLLAWPIGFVIEGSRCDTEAGCRMYGWAALPIGVSEWRLRIRPVTDRNEADSIASMALDRAGSSYSTYNPQRFDDHWIVATINPDGRPGPHAVRIDTRTAATRFVPCPADSMLCGMERPVVSDGERVFSNVRLGLAASFPAGRSVCTARPFEDDLSLDGRGFYGMIRDPDIPCDIIDISRDLGLEALKERTVAEALPQGCQPLSPALLKAFGGRAPRFAGHQSQVCQETADDQVWVGVFAVAGSRSEGGSVSTTLYEAHMRTTEAGLAEDARSFEAFLNRAKIGTLAES
ncbi:hypothetical protein [Brevundimonas sp.]|uniref:hypothetical protein n=1 Tax=Brevundimonas sp. TaxID=1871086 RepID=UPI00121D5478|nr:hypothetical protein [Brevundimonas sp.]TAJ62529.1 MAG: hypothetical protein EPO49_08390 [Brevundimonas sp.]